MGLTEEFYHLQRHFSDDAFAKAEPGHRETALQKPTSGAKALVLYKRASGTSKLVPFPWSLATAKLRLGTLRRRLLQRPSGLMVILSYSKSVVTFCD